jgi:succinate-semialdehyde dehydrogenase/glutarate-semialdehyde dehydrogenase
MVAELEADLIRFADSTDVRSHNGREGQSMAARQVNRVRALYARWWLGPGTMRIVVIGGSGHVGSFLVPRLVRAGHEVVSLTCGARAPYVDDEAWSQVEQILVDRVAEDAAATRRSRWWHASLGIEFVERVTQRVRRMRVGCGLDGRVHIGPLIDAKAAASTDALVSDAIDRGARLTTGGRPRDGPGFFYAPTVPSEVPTKSRLMPEEIFGPCWQ